MEIGIDIVENRRIEKSLNENFISKVLTHNEYLIYKQKKGKKQLEFICGRFCAKEAIIKCISDFENPPMKDIEILNNSNGKPMVKYKNYNILITISHEINYTAAFAILKNNV